MPLTIDELIILYPDELECWVLKYEILNEDDVYIIEYENPFGD